MPLLPKDTNVPVQFKTPLGDGVLLVRSIQGKEKMGGLFVFHLDLISEQPDLVFDDVVGQQVTVILKVDEEDRYFNGYITEFTYLGRDGVYYRYHATIRPWLWLLTRTSDCRIFQNLTVPEIIKEVYRLNHMVDFEERLNASYRTWDYCVQYNESDFNFISRLMEQEGIYYFFEHQADKHVLVMADDAGAHNPYPGFAQIHYLPDLKQGAVTRFSLNTWTARQSIVPNKYAVQDFDFENPKVNLLSKYNKDIGHAWPIEDPEIFDYPGEYVRREDGNLYAEIRLQELLCQRERMHASGECRGLSPGCTFTLNDYPREDQNKEYLTVSIEHEMNNHEFMSGELEGKTVYRCELEVLAVDKMPFRTPRKTPKPKVQGPQTAIVVGPAGDEIYTDEYGRVKVQFHWDRYGLNDENSSCWVRVSQIWAGTKWGGIHIPRIGQEVVVSFLEGDPDRPLITGSVYNANCMPPYALTTNKTQSGIKSRSTLEGGPDNFNEIRMEDKIGEEELYIQAEKDENILVKNDKTEMVGHNETIEIGHDRQEKVGNDETINVGNDRQESVGHDESLSVTHNRTRNVGVDETIEVGGKRTHNVDKDEVITIGVNQSTTVKNNQSIGVGSNRALDVKKNHSVSVAGSEDRDIGKKLVIKAGDSILLECGSASISLKKNGDIKISGKKLVVEASATLDLKASGAIKVKGATIAEN
jgi:type VI secretion system secreted protein VgrG